MRKSKNKNRGFAFLAVAVVIALLAILAGLSLPSIGAILENRAIDAERAALKQLASVIRSGFQRDATVNVSLFSGSAYNSEAGGTNGGTLFASGNYLQAGAIRVNGTLTGIGAANPDLWQSKVSHLLGFTDPSGTSRSITVSGGIDKTDYGRALLINPVGEERFLLLGPITETNQQRYLLVSVMVNSGRGLVLPSSITAAVFDALSTSGAITTAVPTTLLPATEAARWATEDRGKPYHTRILTEMIVQPKYVLRVANTHATATCWVDVGGIANAITSSPASGVTTAANKVLAGREIVIRRGAASPGIEVDRFYMNDNTTYKIQ